MRRPSSPLAWAAWDEASSRGLLLTSPNFRPFRTQNNDNTLPGKEIPLGLCKISTVLTVPLLLLLCGAAWLINTLDSFQDPLLSPLQREPGGSQSASPSSAKGAPLTLTKPPAHLLGRWRARWRSCRLPWCCRGGRGGMCPLLAQDTPQQ